MGSLTPHVAQRVVVDAATLSRPAVRRAAAARALRPHSVVPQEVPVLRLQFARGEGRGAGGRVRRRAPRRSRVRAAVDLGPAGRLGLHRRRHAEPVLGGGDRPAARRRFARACRSRRMPRSRSRRIRERSSARSSRGFRAAGVNRLSLGIQSFDPKHLRRSAACTTPTRRARAAEAALAIFGNVNLDLMYALPRQTVAEARGRRRGRARVRAAAPVVLPADARAQHAVPPLSAAAARRRRRRPTSRTRSTRCSRARGLPALRDVGVRAPRPRMPAQSQLLAVRRLPRHRRRRAFEAVVSRSHRAPGALQAAEAVSRAGRRGRAAAGETPSVARDDVGFEFMLNALRLTDGVPAALFAERTGLSAGARRARARGGRRRAA